MSSEATNWVRDVADVPNALMITLYVIASYTDRAGRGCTASAATLARGARKSKRQVERDLAQLRKLGVIAPGNQVLVSSYPPEQRPVVYDIPEVAEWSGRVFRPRATVTHDGTPHRHPRRHPTVMEGQDPPSPMTVKTPPTGETAPAGAQGSAPRAGRKPHNFADDGVGGCSECLLPEGNRVHKLAVVA